jgi:hypothetical protein
MDQGGSPRAQIGRRDAVAALAGFLVGACTGENEQFSLPPELTERGAFVAALEPGYGYRLNRILAAERFPKIEETLLHLIIYAEIAASFEEAAELAKNEFLTPVLTHSTVLAKEFVKREWKVVWQRSLTAEEEAFLNQ